MPLLGRAALAMWWDLAPEMRADFEDWHSHEHFPERLRVPGFLRGSRWTHANEGSACFVLYELADYHTLTSPAYVERLNNPTPWSVKMMPHHRQMVRSQCRVIESFGQGVGGWLATLRLSPPASQAETVRQALVSRLSTLHQQIGLTGGHLLQTDTPAAPQTLEQKIRGADAAADWIVVLSGYDRVAVEDAASSSFAPALFGALNVQRDVFRLVYTLSSGDQ